MDHVSLMRNWSILMMPSIKKGCIEGIFTTHAGDCV